MSSGHVVAFLDLAIEMLAKCGLSRIAARKVLTPLVQSTLDNLKTSDPVRALTGTFARGDHSTVKQHLEALDSAELADALAAYLVLGRHSLSIAKGGGAEQKRFKEIVELLKTEAKGQGE
jgi:predicted short-subunit dehydrogenase-like oxidoreductase (DUF2520 family)